MKAFFRPRLVPVAAVVLLIAVLPNAFYLGHWPFLPGFESTDTPAEAHEHAGHCHAGPSKCSDAPVSSAQPMLLTTGTLAAVAFGLLLLLAVDLQYSPTNPFAQRIAKPPRRTSAVLTS